MTETMFYSVRILFSLIDFNVEKYFYKRRETARDYNARIKSKQESIFDITRKVHKFYFR